jgi:hypothetical protein
VWHAHTSTNTAWLGEESGKREEKRNLAKAGQAALGRKGTSQARTADEEEQQLSGVHFL